MIVHSRDSFFLGPPRGDACVFRAFVFSRVLGIGPADTLGWLHARLCFRVLVFWARWLVQQRHSLLVPPWLLCTSQHLLLAAPAPAPRQPPRAACCVLMCSRAASIDASDTAKLASLPRCKHASEVERRPQTVEQVTRSVFSKEKCVPSKAAARAIAAASSARCCDPPRSCHQVAACSRPGLHSSAVGTKYRQLTRSNAKLTRRSPLAEVWACMMIGCVS